MIFDHPEFHNHVRVEFIDEADVGLRAIIALHRVRKGNPSIGGIRFRPYPDDADALNDVLRLSRAMTYKSALADIPIGGAKSVIIGDPRVDKTPQLLARFGEAIDALGGRYMGGPDVGTCPADMDIISEHTRYVCSTTRTLGPEGSGPPTAVGVFNAIRALATFLNGGPSLAGLSVAIQGVGSVGSKLAVYLADAGAHVIIADIDGAAVHAVADRASASIETAEKILQVEADIFAPCALGAVLSADTIPELRVRGIAGGANNQLAKPEDAQRLAARGIAMVPDFVANAGGVIAAAAAEGVYPESQMQAKLDGIYDRSLAILERAATDGGTTLTVACRMAQEMIDRA